jgi:excisionase family DNA binding protein
MSAAPTPPAAAPTFLSIAQAVEFAGISTSTVRRLVRLGRLVGYHPSARRVVISRAELLEYLESTRRAAPTTPEPTP